MIQNGRVRMRVIMEKRKRRKMGLLMQHLVVVLLMVQVWGNMIRKRRPVEVLKLMHQSQASFPALKVFQTRAHLHLLLDH